MISKFKQLKIKQEWLEIIEKIFLIHNFHISIIGI